MQPPKSRPHPTNHDDADDDADDGEDDDDDLVYGLGEAYAGAVTASALRVAAPGSESLAVPFDAVGGAPQQPPPRPHHRTTSANSSISSIISSSSSGGGGGTGTGCRISSRTSSRGVEREEL